MARWLADFGNLDFVLVLEASRLFEATNALDHIYAFLGHPKASSGSNQLFSADYSMQVADLNRVVADVLAHESLNFLVQVQHRLDDDLTSVSPLPSWIPQWHIHVRGAPEAYWEWWDASLRIRNKSGTRFRIIDNELTTPALFVGTINLHTDIMKKEDFTAPRSKLGEVLEMCWYLTEAAEEMHPSIYAEHTTGAFAAVLTAYFKENGAIEDWTSDFCKFCSICNGALYADKISKRYKGSVPITTQMAQTEAMELKGRFRNLIRHYCRNRRFFTTESGYWGLGAPGLQLGDVCVVIYGADVPFILRPIQECRKYKLVGQCYISGVMFGEFLRRGQDGMDISEWTDITLV